MAIGWFRKKPEETWERIKHGMKRRNDYGRWNSLNIYMCLTNCMDTDEKMMDEKSGGREVTVWNYSDKTCSYLSVPIKIVLR
jgi:hypothetical protein